MTITLPDEMRADLERKAKSAGFASIEEYVANLVRMDEPGEGPLPDDSFVGSPEISPRNREELERMLDEGMESGPVVIADAAFWAERRRVLRERLARRRGETP